jgi:serine/threonine-protein kinase HipA
VTVRRLAVLLYGRVVGRLEQADVVTAPTFTYDTDYVADGSVALSARLPVRRDAFDAQRVAPYLHGLLPENVDARQRWAQQLGTTADDTFGMLAQMGWDCPGAVQFCWPDDVDSLASRAGEHAPVDEPQVAARLRRLAEEPASWTMPEEHWSLGGQQEKFAVARIDGRWFQAHGAAATTHIVKPGIRALHSQALVEHVTMRAASLLGVDVAETRYLPFEDQWAIVVQRFDRVVAQDGSIARLHQEDFCQAVGRMPSRKYEQQGGPTLADMVGVSQRQSSDVGADRLALADFLVINLVAGAPDGHAKNISLLRLREGAWVAPLYDLATGLAYDSRHVDRSVALSIGGERQPSRVRRRQWERASTIVGVSPDSMCRRVEQLAAGYPGAFRAALAEVQDAPGADELVRRALPDLETHCSRLLAQLA